MPFDGTTVAGVVHELSVLIGGRIDKITQPEKDEIFLNIRAKGANYKLLLTVNPNAPRVCLTAQNKNSPLTAPMFCMVLRKHISGGRISSVVQPDFDRIIEIHIEASDEMGDRVNKILLIEIMGKHSNIMLISNEKVLDAIKHVPLSVSMVRPILPGAVYSRPPSQGKQNPMNFSEEKFLIETKKYDEKTLYKHFNGISPQLACEIYNNKGIFSRVKANDFECTVYKDECGKAVDFSVLPFSIYAHLNKEKFNAPSEMIEAFYSKRDEMTRINQKTADIRASVNDRLERCRNKTFIYDKTLEEVKDRDGLRLKGELLTAYIYLVKSGAESFTAENFYDGNKPLEIALSPELSASENAQEYFKQYNKQKRTFAAVRELISKNNDDLIYLESVASAIDIAGDEADIAEIRAELTEQGFLKHRAAVKNKKAVKTSKPLKYISSDGFEIYVGKNNTQNDYLTLRTANPRDIWFHTKETVGSHVILITGGKEPSETAILEAANLAAQNSRASKSSNVPVDYVARKYVRKPAGAKPGYVIYDRHKTVYVTPD